MTVLDKLRQFSLLDHSLEDVNQKFDEIVKDYRTPEIWLLYAQSMEKCLLSSVLSLGILQEKLTSISTIYERGIAQCGDNFHNGSILWHQYRAFLERFFRDFIYCEIKEDSDNKPAQTPPMTDFLLSLEETDGRKAIASTIASTIETRESTFIDLTNAEKQVVMKEALEAKYPITPLSKAMDVVGDVKRFEIALNSATEANPMEEKWSEYLDHVIRRANEGTKPKATTIPFSFTRRVVSVFERALWFLYNNAPLWLRYVNFVQTQFVKIETDYQLASKRITQPDTPKPRITNAERQAIHLSKSLMLTDIFERAKKMCRSSTEIHVQFLHWKELEDTYIPANLATHRSDLAYDPNRLGEVETTLLASLRQLRHVQSPRRSAFSRKIPSQSPKKTPDFLSSWSTSDWSSVLIATPFLLPPLFRRRLGEEEAAEERFGTRQCVRLPPSRPPLLRSSLPFWQPFPFQIHGSPPKFDPFRRIDWEFCAFLVNFAQTPDVAHKECEVILREVGKTNGRSICSFRIWPSNQETTRGLAQSSKLDWPLEPSESTKLEGDGSSSKSDTKLRDLNAHRIRNGGADAPLQHQQPLNEEPAMVKEPADAEMDLDYIPLEVGRKRKLAEIEDYVTDDHSKTMQTERVTDDPESFLYTDVNTLFAKQIPVTANEDDVSAVFEEGSVKEVRLNRNLNGELLGYGYIEFHSKEAMEQGLLKNGAKVNGVPIKLTISKPKGPRERPPVQKDQRDKFHRKEHKEHWEQPVHHQHQQEGPTRKERREEMHRGKQLETSDLPVEAESDQPKTVAPKPSMMVPRAVRKGMKKRLEL
ncbi:hypothetical protein BLNAU_24122 [Blattamonas nauphoetae]|uniref:RRM domain-containing protein n=1 Tax=Blattamonas nauphoetae TaxID=2049346 RepID=A0ABQ9WPA7_9EUKA|nr:hypothetical protein BLNAU_24122 [Blattamonas nauphoetae]